MTVISYSLVLASYLRSFSLLKGSEICFQMIDRRTPYMKATPTIPRPTTTIFLRPSAILAAREGLPTPVTASRRSWSHYRDLQTRILISGTLQQDTTSKDENGKKRERSTKIWMWSRATKINI